MHTAAEVFYDDTVLARRARTTLAGAESGVMFIGGERWRALSATPVEVADDDGEPVLTWAPTPAVTAAAANGRLVTLILAPNPGFGVRLTMSGRLIPTAAGTEGQAALRVEQVLVGCPHDGRSGPTHTRELALTVYALAEPDELAAAIPRTVRHLNTGHEAELRQAAGALCGSEIASARIDELSATGVTLSWVDSTGGRTVSLPFEPAATTMADVGLALRCALTAAVSERPSP